MSAIVEEGQTTIIKEGEPIEPEVVISEEINTSRFKRLTKTSLEELEERICEERVKKKEQEWNIYTGKLSIWDREKVPKRNKALTNGLPLPACFKEEFATELTYTPLEEIDPAYAKRGVKTFVVVNGRGVLYRFSTCQSFFCASPMGHLRRICVRIATHPLFAAFMALVIILHCISLMMIIHNPAVFILRSLAQLCYLLEVLILMVARGVILQPFSYLRTTWGWLDTILMIDGILATINPYQFGYLAPLRGFRMFRLLLEYFGHTKASMAATAITKMSKSLLLALPLPLLIIIVCASFLKSTFIGALDRRCVTDVISAYNESTWSPWVDDSHLCGNASNSRICLVNQTCLQLEKTTYSSNEGFDDFVSSFIQTTRIMTRDDTGVLLHQLVLTVGNDVIVLMVLAFILLIAFFLLTSGVLTAIVETKDMYNYGCKPSTKKSKGAWNDDDEDEADETMKMEDVDNFEKEDTIEIALNNTRPKAATKRRHFIKNVEPCDAADASIDTQTTDVEQGPRKTLKIPANCPKDCLNCITQCCCYYKTCSPWNKFQQKLATVVTHPVMDIIVSIFIVSFCATNAVDHHGMSPEQSRIMIKFVYLNGLFFTLEFILKLAALGPRPFFKSLDNWILCIGVVCYILRLGLENVQGLSILYTGVMIITLRLIWVVGLLPYADTYRLFLSMLKYLDHLLSWLLTLFTFSIILISIFLLETYDNAFNGWNESFPETDTPRLTFTDMIHSFGTTYQLALGRWSLVVKNFYVLGYQFAPFILLVVVAFLNWGFVHLILASLLLTPKEYETIELKAKSRRELWMSKLKKICNLTKKIPQNKVNDSTEEVNPDLNKTSTSWHKSVASKVQRFIPSQKKSGHNWHIFRSAKIVQSYFFNLAVGMLIVLSTFTLALYNDNSETLHPTFATVVFVLDRFIIASFFLELILRITAYGGYQFFCDRLCVLDLLVVLASIINLLLMIQGHDSIGVLQAFRVVRLARLFGSCYSKQLNVFGRVIVRSAPVILFVGVMHFFWIMQGLQSFAGRFYYCADEDGSKLDAYILPDGSACEMENYTWVNSLYNFDNSLTSSLSVLLLSSTYGESVIHDTSDCREVNQQPNREGNIFGSVWFFFFFTIISVIVIIKFYFVIIWREIQNEEKTMKSALDEKSKLEIHYLNWWNQFNHRLPPTVSMAAFHQNRIRRVTSMIVHSVVFEVISLAVIVIYVIVYNSVSYNTIEFDNISYYFDFAFLAWIILETVLRFMSLGMAFFKEGLCMLDFFICLLCPFAIVLIEPFCKYFLCYDTFLLLRIFRLLRLDRVLRNLSWFRLFITQLTALKILKKELFMLVYQMFLIILSFSIIGFHVYGRSPIEAFHYTRTAFHLLFGVMISGNWGDIVMNMNPEPICGILIFLAAFLLLMYITLAQMLLTIWKGCDEIRNRLMDGLIPLDGRLFSEKWRSFDPQASRFIHINQLSDLMNSLRKPLQIRQPNEMRLAALDIPVRIGGLVAFTDVANAAFKNSLCKKGYSWEELQSLVIPSKYIHTMQITSSSKEYYLKDEGAKLIQKSWRHYKTPKEENSEINRDSNSPVEESQQAE